jgi:acetyl-CoA acetyltransferase family protein
MASKKHSPQARDVILVDAVRTPFCKSNGALLPLMSHELGRDAIKGLVAKTGIEPAIVDQVIMGSVVQDPRTSNLAREAMLGAGLLDTTPAYTTTLACISANVAATNAADAIALGRCDVVIAGGAESFSDPPIRLSKNLRQALVKMQKAKGPAAYLDIVKDLSPQDLAPDVPSAAEFSTGLTMGQSCERMARRLGVTRQQSDEFAVRSHVLAGRAWAAGHYRDDVIPIALPPRFHLINQDDGPRADSTVASVQKLRPAFDASFGVITAASSSFLTDGAAATLLMSRSRAEALNMPRRVVLRDHVYAAGSPLEELLAGPALSIPKLLHRHGMVAADIGVWEIHEAFAAQVVANLQLLRDAAWLRDRTGTEQVIDVPLEHLNQWGGSLSLGHPFGATGARLLSTCMRRMIGSGSRFGVVSGCATGGHGSAILLEQI